MRFEISYLHLFFGLFLAILGYVSMTNMYLLLDLGRLLLAILATAMVSGGVTLIVKSVASASHKDQSQLTD